MSARVKIKFQIEEDRNDIESMFAIPCGDNCYVLDNSPFYAFGISYCDEFKANIINGELTFESIVARSGHSTYRIRLPIDKEHNYFLKHWQELEKLGCSYEGSSVNNNKLYAVDIPPSVDVYKAYEIMKYLENQGIWEFEEGHYCLPEERPANQH